MRQEPIVTVAPEQEPVTIDEQPVIVLEEKER